MPHTVFASVMSSLRGAVDAEVDASTYVSSQPSNVSMRDAVAPLNIFLQSLSEPAFWETKTLGILLGLVIIFVIGYIRSPWRKLPPSPWRLPILGHALQLRDKSWLLSKDCKERFGEFIDCTPVVMLRCVYGIFQERLCTLTDSDSP